MPYGDQNYGEFEKKSCRTCGYWITRPDNERCPNCATFHPLRGKHRYDKRSLFQSFFKGSVFGGMAGAGIAGITAWLAGTGWSVAGIPLIAITSGLFGAGLLKSMFRFSEKALLMSFGILIGGAAALLYTLGWPIPSALWIAAGALAGHRFLHDSFYALPQQRLMDMEDQVFHEKVVGRARERQHAIDDKLKSFRKLKREVEQREGIENDDSLRTIEQAENTLHQARQSYEELQVKTQLHLQENHLRKWKDNLFEVTDDNEKFYRIQLAALLEAFRGFEQQLEKNEKLPLDTREELIGHTQRAIAAIQKLEVEATKRNILAETKNVSAIPDAHLADDQLLAPSSQTGDFTYDDLDAELVNYDVFNELEDEYVRLKVEGELDPTDGQ